MSIFHKKVADPKALRMEALALRCFQGHGGIELVEEGDGFLETRMAVPGITLENYFPDRDDEAVIITCNLIMRLHTAALPAANSFPHVNDWLAAFNTSTALSSLPAHVRELAQAALVRLADDAPRPDALLHGDLHHGNIVQDGTAWLAIDPKGVIGDPAFEPAAFIRNPMSALWSRADAAGIVQKRIRLFACLLSHDPQRIADWCLVQAALSWVWAVEDGVDKTCFRKAFEVCSGVMKN